MGATQNGRNPALLPNMQKSIMVQKTQKDRVVNMDTVKAVMIDYVRRIKHGTPCIGKASLWECFTEFYGRLMLWYNNEHNSTRTFSVRIPA